MKLTKEQFLQRKKTDTLFVFGSGYSINGITKEEWDKIKNYDSISFNWFCKHWFAPTFYVIREQANNKNRVSLDETPNHLMNAVTKESYKNTVIIIINTAKHSPGAFDYRPFFEKSSTDFIVLRDLKKRGSLNVDNLRNDIFSCGTLHGKCSLTNVMHIALCLGYKKIVFAGVDLYNSRYFWLSKNKSRHTIVRKGINVRDKHPIAKNVCKLIGRIRDKFNVRMYCMNKKSLLSRYIETLPGVRDWNL